MVNGEADHAQKPLLYKHCCSTYYDWHTYTPCKEHVDMIV